LNPEKLKGGNARNSGVLSTKENEAAQEDHGWRKKMNNPPLRGTGKTAPLIKRTSSS